MELCYKSQKIICSKKGENILIVQNREGESTEVLEGSVEKEVYLTIKITTDITGILCAEEEKDGARLLIFKQLGKSQENSIKSL